MPTLGIVGAYPPGSPQAFEVRAFLGSGRPAAAAARRARWHAVTIGGLISYRDGPVGPYGVFGAAVMLRGAPMLSHIPFMAVDSAASVAGGRGNWALPKELADFDRDPARPGPARSQRAVTAGSCASRRPPVRDGCQ